MIDADRYWGTLDLVAAQRGASRIIWPILDRERVVSAEQLDGGCLLYRLSPNRPLWRRSASAHPYPARPPFVRYTRIDPARPRWTEEALRGCGGASSGREDDSHIGRESD